MSRSDANALKIKESRGMYRMATTPNRTPRTMTHLGTKGNSSASRPREMYADCRFSSASSDCRPKSA